MNMQIHSSFSELQKRKVGNMTLIIIINHRAILIITLMIELPYIIEIY